MRTFKIERNGVFVIFFISIILQLLSIITKSGPFKVISPLNASMWEHMKMMFFAGFIFMIIEIFLKVSENKNFFIAKFISLITLTLSVPMLYYTYSNFIGKSVPIINIIIDLLCATVSQYISYKILNKSETVPIARQIASICAIILNVFILVYFSFNPLNTQIFAVWSNSLSVAFFVAL